MSCSRCFGQFCLLVIMHEVCLACCKNLCVTSNQTPIDRHDEFHVFGAIGMWCIIPAAALLFLLVPAGKGDDGAYLVSSMKDSTIHRANLSCFVTSC